MLVLFVIVLIIAAGVAGYAFRGKEEKALRQVGQDIKSKL